MSRTKAPIAVHFDDVIVIAGRKYSIKNFIFDRVFGRGDDGQSGNEAVVHVIAAEVQS